MKYCVHRYDVVRVKVAVEADSQEEAMKKADEMLEKNHPLREWSAYPSIMEEDKHLVEGKVILPMSLAVEHAEEVTGYLVDEVGDGAYKNSTFYEADMSPARSESEEKRRG